ncbi:e9imm peptide [Streptomyces sp. NPDC049597]|uniref:e9imm peptide n=1 Tax=Streptomyces sp. NPDC049597 TaxID=3155276 RepID=UPI00343ED0E2
MSREEAIPLVECLMNGGTDDEAKDDAIMEALERGLACPHIGNYIFWDFDQELSAAKIVDRALAYKPIAL